MTFKEEMLRAVEENWETEVMPAIRQALAQAGLHGEAAEDLSPLFKPLALEKVVSYCQGYSQACESAGNLVAALAGVRSSPREQQLLELVASHLRKMPEDL